jgi:hypothetical protein
VKPVPRESIGTVDDDDDATPIPLAAACANILFAAHGGRFAMSAEK